MVDRLCGSVLGRAPLALHDRQSGHDLESESTSFLVGKVLTDWRLTDQRLANKLNTISDAPIRSH